MDFIQDFYSFNYSLNKTSNILYPANNNYKNYKINDNNNSIDNNLSSSYKTMDLKDFSPTKYNTINNSPSNDNKRFKSANKYNNNINNNSIEHKNNNIKTLLNSIQDLKQNQIEIYLELKGLKDLDTKTRNNGKKNNHELLSTVNKLKEDYEKMRKEYLILKKNDKKDKKIKELEDLLKKGEKEKEDLKKKLIQYQNENKAKDEEINYLKNELEKIKLNNNNIKVNNADIINSISTEIISNENIFNSNDISNKK